MSEAAALISGLDNLPAMTGAAAPSPHGAAPDGGFAGVLSQRLQETPPANSPAVAPSAAAMTEEGRGEGSPQMGKPLPLAVADTDPDAESGGDAAYLDGVLLNALPVLDVPEGGLPTSPLSPTQIWQEPTTSSSAIALLDDAPLDDASHAQPYSAPTMLAAGTTPLAATTATSPPPAPLQAAIVSNIAPPAAPVAADVSDPLASTETQAASLKELPPPDWLAMRMAKAGGLDSRPAAPQALSLNRPEGAAPAGGGQDVLHMLGIRPMFTSGNTPRGEGGRPIMALAPGGFPGDSPMINATTPLSDPGISAAGIFSSAATAQPSSVALPTLSIAAPVGQGTWSQDMGQRVTWLANQEIREAQIQLNPRHLGPVDVRIAYGQEQQLSVSFIAHHPQAREALDAMLPRLREMFDGQGLNLADVSVSQESFTERRRSPANSSNPSRGYGGGGDDFDPVNASPPTLRASGLFDAYA